MITLTPVQRRELRARAHALHPVVAIGHAGLTAPVLHEIDVALAAHELIKIRVHSDDREAREAMLARVCTELAAASVQHLGKLLIVWRPAPEPAPEPAAKRRPSKPRRSGAADKKAGAPPARERRGHSAKTGERHAKHRRGTARHTQGTPATPGSVSALRRRIAQTMAAPKPAASSARKTRTRDRSEDAPVPREPGKRGRPPGDRPAGRRPAGGPPALRSSSATKPPGAPPSVRRRRRPTGRT